MPANFKGGGFVDPSTPYAEIPAGALLASFRGSLWGIQTRKNGTVVVSLEVSDADKIKALALSSWPNVTVDLDVRRHDFKRKDAE